MMEEQHSARPADSVGRTLWIAIGICGWMSFLGAAVATMLFFATFDPQELAQLATFPMELGRMAGYSIGFLCFWVLLLINSLAVAWLLLTRSEK